MVKKSGSASASKKSTESSSSKKDAALAPGAKAPGIQGKSRGVAKAVRNHKRELAIGVTNRGVHRLCRRAGIERHGNEVDNSIQALTVKLVTNVLRKANTCMWYGDRVTFNADDVNYACRELGYRRVYGC